MYRSYHQRDAIHKADHFFNFCVTAHSMRDYFLERLGMIEKSDRQPFEDQWAKESLLVAAADIANSTKHFVLRSPRTLSPRTVTTKRVGLRKSEFVNIYMNDRGEIRTVPTLAHDMIITVSDGQKYDLYKFMIDVLDYWRSFLARHGIRVRRQSIVRLRGSDT
jgi:hypothetical protein